MLRVLKTGFYSTIQDSGRFGYRKYGVPVSGAMDSYSSRFANALLGNDKNAALIEMTMIGGKFQFLEPTSIVVSGAFMAPKLNDIAIKPNRVVAIKANDILSFGKTESGIRAYLAVKGGFKTDVILGSRSQYNPVSTQNVIQKDEYIRYKPELSDLTSFSSVKYDQSVINCNILESFKGPEFFMLNKNQKQVLLSNDYTVSNLNNRMAYQLEPSLENNLLPILSTPVLSGTVQLTPKGNLIVLMRDCQTTGGYPRVLQLTEKAINKLAQKTSGNTINFRLKE
ncbi:biotin-dependent carboxyltransferase family protein [Winogradskyella sp. HB-48]|uniref:5-oxoprolinase subunit C family protein n=1 Tax=Winogradskyella sp. HB-48 TaxID=3416808 RepID=UPI003CEADBCE